MSKRRSESTSSSSSSSEDYSTDADCSSQSSIDDPSFTLSSSGQTTRKKPQQAPSANWRKSSVDLKQKELPSVVSASTQFQSELGNIVKNEMEEVEVEHNGLKDSAEQRMGVDCSSSAIDQQAQLKVRRSKRQRVSVNAKRSEDPKQPPSKPPSKKVCVSNSHEKYFEGCLVMAWGGHKRKGIPYWPGMIRKAGADDGHPDYFQNERGRIWFFVQFFTDPSITVWRIPGDMRLFNAAKPNQCNLSDPEFVAHFEKGVRIAKAALKFPLEDRLANFTLPDEASTFDSLFKVIEEWNFSQSAPGNGSVAQLEYNTTQGNVRIRADSAAQVENKSTLPTNANGESCSESVARNEIAPAPLANGNRESCPDSVEIMKKRISEYQQKLRDECSREKNEEIKRLTKDKEKLTETVKEQANTIAELQEEREKEKQEKLMYKEELEKMKAMFKEMFGGFETK